MSTLLFGVEAMAAATVILLIARAFAALTESAGLRHLIRLGGFAALLMAFPSAMIVPSKLVLRAAPAVATTTPADSGVSFIGWAMIGLIAIWAAGALMFLARGFAGALALRALRRRSRPHSFAANRLTYWTARAGLAGDWALRLSADTGTPLSWGIFHPIVMLPEQCADWAADQIDAAMLHELAHLRRRDGLAQMIAMIGCALYWLNPLVWAEAKALRADAEIAADDMVILSGVKPSAYAELLLHAAGGAMRRGSFAGLELAMAERPGLETRIQSILSPNQSRSGVTKMQIIKTVFLGACAALLVALARPSFGADAPSAPLVPGAVVQSPEKAPAPAKNVSPPVTQNTAPLSSRRRRSAGIVTGRHSAVTPNEVDASIATTVAKELADAHIDETVAKAVADARVAETVTKSLADAHLDETIAKAVADAHIGETVTKALADAHLDGKINAALKKAQPQIDAAIARQQRLLQQLQQPAVSPPQ
jgi:beta-lactamase regulating signal transducer with metallopeptidase domain